MSKVFLRLVEPLGSRNLGTKVSTKLMGFFLPVPAVRLKPGRQVPPHGIFPVVV